MTTTIAECPLCHTIDSTPSRSVDEMTWRCVRCGQHWDAARLSAVAAHQQWLALHAPL